MKNASILLFFSVFIFSGILNAQTVNEKLIATIPQSNGYSDAYSLKYDSKTGSWLYAQYDTTSRKYTLITPTGSSLPFDLAMQYNSVFDANGNVYTIASDNLTDTTFRYHIVKNNEVIGTYDFINEGWAIKDGILYFAAKDSGKEYLVAYDTKSAQFTKGKAYDEVRLANIPVKGYEGEPMGYVGFTKTGKPYYFAVESGYAFLVLGADEQKHYSDISWYELSFDKNDNPCYIAKSSGKFYDEKGNTFVVQGTNEYKAFDWIYGPIIFDSNNESPVYVGQDSTGEYKYRSTLMKGSGAVKTVDGNIYNYVYSPSGKLAYTVTTESQNKSGDFISANRLVYDGKESAVYNSIGFIQFSGNTALFIAADKKNKYFVVSGSKTITGKYDYIAEYSTLANGDFSYVGTTYGVYDKNIPDKNYIFIGGDKMGPYEFVSTTDYTTNKLILSDKQGNYAYVAGKNTDLKNYFYVYKVYTNKWESKQFEAISDTKLVNGKVIFFAGTQITKGMYYYNYQLYVNNKPVGDKYTAYADLTVDDSGNMRFIASKGNNMYLVEVKQ